MSVSTHAELSAAKKTLVAKLQELYGEAGYCQFDESSKQRFWRFSTGLRKNQIAVTLQMTDYEWAHRDEAVFDGKSLDEYMSLIPKEIDGIEVVALITPTAVAHAS